MPNCITMKLYIEDSITNVTHAQNQPSLFSQVVPWKTEKRRWGMSTHEGSFVFIMHPRQPKISFNRKTS